MPMSAPTPHVCLPCRVHIARPAYPPHFTSSIRHSFTPFGESTTLSQHGTAAYIAMPSCFSNLLCTACGLKARPQEVAQQPRPPATTYIHMNDTACSATQKGLQSVSTPSAGVTDHCRGSPSATVTCGPWATADAHTPSPSQIDEIFIHMATRNENQIHHLEEEDRFVTTYSNSLRVMGQDREWIVVSPGRAPPPRHRQSAGSSSCPTHTIYAAHNRKMEGLAHFVFRNDLCVYLTAGGAGAPVLPSLFAAAMAPSWVWMLGGLVFSASSELN